MLCAVILLTARNMVENTASAESVNVFSVLSFTLFLIFVSIAVLISILGCC